jgi:hypothetical protein
MVRCEMLAGDRPIRTAPTITRTMHARRQTSLERRPHSEPAAGALKSAWVMQSRALDRNGTVKGFEDHLPRENSAETSRLRACAPRVSQACEEGKDPVTIGSGGVCRKSKRRKERDLDPELPGFGLHVVGTRSSHGASSGQVSVPLAQRSARVPLNGTDTWPGRFIARKADHQTETAERSSSRSNSPRAPESVIMPRFNT